MNYTQNYQLPQWESGDRIMMEDFNEAMGRIDTGLSELATKMPHTAGGSYMGTGEYGRDKPNTLTFSFKPSAVVLFEPGEEPLIFSSLGTSEDPVPLQGGVIGAYWEGNTLTWWAGRDATLQHNAENHRYHYFAL